MSPQVSIITLGVSDLNRAKEFYSVGLGLPVQQEHSDLVILGLGQGSSALGLFPRDELAQDAGVAASGDGFQGFALSYLVESAEQVDLVLKTAVQAGGRITKPAKRAIWGGYSGYFSDVDGYLWKVASKHGHPLVRRRQSEGGPPSLAAQETAVTIGVQDVKRTKQFYGDALGSLIDKDYGSKFVSFKADGGSSTLAVYQWNALADDAGVAHDGSGFHGFTLTYAVDSASQVDSVLATAAQSGGQVSKPGQRTASGGYSGYFSDPDGNLWRVVSRT